MNRLKIIWKSFCKKIQAWPLMTKVTVPFSVFFMISGATLLAMVLQDDITANVSLVSDTEAGTEWYTEIVLIETETETETESNGLEVVMALPDYQPITMYAESIEQDLTVYLEDADEVNITGVGFKVKLVACDQTETIERLQELIAEIGDTSILEYEVPETYADQELTDEEIQIIKKQEAISAYASAIAAADGIVLTDDDEDGIIYEDGLESGDFVLFFVPILQYDATEYAMDVTVKEEVEYTAITTIEKKVVSYDSADDPQASVTNTQVETVEEDTVQSVEFSTDTSGITYSTAVTMDLGIAASVSADVNSTVSTNELSDAENSTEDTSAATVTSELTISSTLALYANASAASATVMCTSLNATNLSLSADEALSSYLTIQQATGGYLVSITKPTSVTEDLTGTLTFSGTDAGGGTIQVTCAVTVIGANTLLSDEDGNQLYYEDSSGTMKEATVGTYSSSVKYCYVIDAGTIVYYGWQTMDGKTYYYDENGNAVTGTQTISGVTYYFASDGSLITEGLGIDVSKWQGTIDWSKASAAISFAIIRCGFRYQTSRTLAEDPQYLTNIKNAKANGVKVGIYFYSTALTEAQAVEEASLAVSLAKQAGSLDLPIFIDIEDSIQASLTKSQRDAIVLAFCKTVTNSGYEAGVYASKSWMTDSLTASKFSNYMIWVAQYNTKCTYAGRYEIWQYSRTGKIPGISEYVDLNYGYF